MTTKRNTLDNIASNKLASLRSIEIARLARQEACHVEYRGTDIYGNERETPYVFRSVPGKDSPEQARCATCTSVHTYEIYHYLTCLYRRCNSCGREECYVYNRSASTRALQWKIAYAYPTFMARLTEEIAEEQNEKRLERNRRARDNRNNLFAQPFLG